LYKYLVDSGVNAWLFDKNSDIIRRLREKGYESVTECDLFSFKADTSRFDWAVADPPWYIEHYHAFLKAGHSILLPGGKMLMSVLPRLTRPSAAKDRFEVVERAARLGFDLVEIGAGALHYESPRFEIEALLAEDLTVGEWRTGDLFAFVARSRKSQKEALRTKVTDPEKWESIPFGETTIKIKVEQSDSRDPFDFRAASFTGSVRFQSVSRRSPARTRINFWTSRNVALTITKPAMVAEFLRKIVDGESIREALVATAYEYQLSDDELDRLQRLMELLSPEAKP
jgi:hypothetical protein